jgi:hypothetical protein
MFNIRLSGIAAGIAFILSLLLGLISGTLPPALIVRPFVFAIVFFIIANLIMLLVNRFLPELLEKNVSKPDIVMPGSQINIMEGNAAVPGSVYAHPEETEGGMGDISNMDNSSSFSEMLDDLAAAGNPQGGTSGTSNLQGMDHSEQSDYTSKGGSSAASENGGSFEGLPDMETLEGSFNASSSEKEEEAEEYQSFGEDLFSTKSSAAQSKAPALEGDYSPKDLAQGIRTILKKEEG